MTADVVTPAPPGAAALAEEVDQRARQVAGALVACRHDLHRHPELPNREVRTAAVVADHLRGLGLDDVRTGIAGHGVVGVLRGTGTGTGLGRVACLRADMDALPVRETSGVPFASTAVDADYPGGPFPVAHACGHDCHTAVVLSAASVLAPMRDRLPGTVVFLFQPAEEGPPVDEDGGAAAMLAAGALDDPAPTMVFGMHVAPFPRGHVAYRAGSQFAASSLLRVVVRGIPAHASSPWQGVDPMPAAAAIVSGSAQVHRQVPAWEPVTVSFGHLEDHGRFNVIGETVTLWGTVRAGTAVQLAAVQERLTRLAHHAAEAHGCTAEVDHLQPVPPVRNTPAWLDAVLPTIRRVVGEDRVVPAPPTMVYDDVAVFVDAFGGAYLQYGVQDTVLVDGELRPEPAGRGLVPNHHPGFYADDGCLTDAVRVHAHVAVDHLLGGAVG